MNIRERIDWCLAMCCVFASSFFILMAEIANNLYGFFYSISKELILYGDSLRDKWTDEFKD